MAAPNDKIHTLPWPALAGVSLLLHVSALGIGLPLMLQVGTPASRSVPIPIALVDDGAAAPAPIPQTAPISAELTPQPTPIGGTNAAERELTQTSPPTEQPAAQQNIPPEQSDGTLAKEPSIERPTTSRDEVDAPPVENQTPENQTPENQPSASEAAESETANDAIAISILGVSTVPPNTLGDWPETLPTLQSASTLRIPGGHSCGNQLPTGAVTLGLIIEDDGSVSEAFAPADGDTISAQVASCLISRADGLRFTPAYSGGAAVATDRMQLTVEFYAG